MTGSAATPPAVRHPILLVDYSSLLYRAFHSMPPSVPMHAVHGFLGMLARLVRDRRPGALGVAVDEDWRPAFRVDALPSYKAHRVAAPDGEPDPVAAHEVVGREVLRALGIAVIGATGFEAEDVIATLAARATAAVEIVSGDRDCFALVRDPDVAVLYPLSGTRHLLRVDEAEITRRYGIPGRAYSDFAILRGDPSDGLPGVRGIGATTAARLLAEHRSLAQLLAAPSLPPAIAQRLAAARAYLEAARRVVPPVASVPLPAVSLALPSRVADSAMLAQLACTYRLEGAIGRLAQALGLAV